MSLQEQLRAERAKTERWIHQREAEIRQVAARAEAKGRQVYANAIKTGQKVLAGTPVELRQLGIVALKGPTPKGTGKVVATRATPRPAKPASRPTPESKPSNRSPAAPSLREEIKQQLDAGVSGFVDEATMGLADHVLAGGGAVLRAAQERDVSGLRHNYDASMAMKRQEDAYDAKHHGVARNVGRATGFLTSVAALGAPSVTRALVSKLPRATALVRDVAVATRRGPDPRGLTKLAAAGGALAGGTGQVATDVITGRTPDARDGIGALLGGAAGGVTTRFAGPTVGGAVDGVTTSMVTDMLHGQAPSLDDALADGRTAASLGRVGDIAGRHWASNLSKEAKGELGETLSRAKSVMRGDKITGTQKRVSVGGRGYTVADEVGVTPRTGQAYVGESKLGPGARLSPRQSQAQKLYGDRYILDYWSFGDVGKAAGAAIAPIGANLGDEERAFGGLPRTPTINPQRDGMTPPLRQAFSPPR